MNLRPSRARCLPRVEALEDRTVPALTFKVVPNGGPGGGALLQITSNRVSDDIVINDDGSGKVNNITVGTFSPGVAVSKVLFNGRRGGDMVVYNLTGDLQGTSPTVPPATAGLPREIEVHMAKGVDRFVANFTGHNLLANSDLFLTAGAGRGPDSLQVNADQGDGTDIGTGARLRVNLNAFNKRGDDSVGFNYKGVQNGTLNFHLFGGTGRDQVGANVELLQGSTGSSPLGLGVGDMGDPATVEGGSGRDDLTFLVHSNNNPNVGVFGEIRGGGGRDVGRRTANIKSFSLETDMVLP
jgi:hypothetical protein